MHRGYIKLWRKVSDSQMYRNHKLWALWSYLLLNVTHKKLEVYAGIEKVTLYPGQIITGRKRLAQELSMSQQNIRTLLLLLKNHKNLTIKSTNKYSIITIVNWGSYQSDEEKATINLTSIQPATNQQLTTKQEHKNIRSNTYTSDFENFWSAYPKKIGKGKASESFKRAKKNGDLVDMLKAIEIQSKSEQWQKDNGQYIPHPATWLNQRRWEDEIKTDSQAPIKYWKVGDHE